MGNDSNEYLEGRRTGAASTQEQARGARDAEHERQQAERERRERYEAIRQQEEARQRQEQQLWEQEHQRRLERQRQEQADREAEARRVAEQQDAERRRKRRTPTAKFIVGFIGFLAGAALGYETAPDNLLVIGIFGAVAAAVAAALYKFIIGLVIVIGALWIWAESEARTQDPPGAAETSPIAGPLDAPPSAARPTRFCS